MYTIFFHKEQKENVEHEITKVIHDYLLLRPTTSGVICFPGYMTKDAKIKDYWSVLFDDVVNSDFYVAFSYGMTSNGRWEKNKEIIESKSLKHLKYLDLKIPALRDHSKVMLFYKWKAGGPQFDLNSIKIAPSVVMENCVIEAVLLGSSNQSYSTYFGSPSAYGESDVMLIASNHRDGRQFSTPEEIFRNDVKDEESTSERIHFDMDKCVVAKSINYTYYDQDVEFLRDIAENLLGIKRTDD